MNTRRQYVAPDEGSLCQHCGNDGSNIITCDNCHPPVHYVVPSKLHKGESEV
ncbi:hypothetical protein ACVWZV_002232 [Bradyrhizobium sp. GM5.1]